MQQQAIFWRWLVKRLAYLLAATCLCGGLLSMLLAYSSAATDVSGSPAWSSPSAMTIHRVSTLTGARAEPALFNNLDCTVFSFRAVSSDTMRSGCFTETVFGLLDTDTGEVVFGGTDEALPLIAYAPHQVLAPWPGALDLLSLDPVDTGGTYVSLYRNPLLVLRDQRDLLGRLQAKTLTAPPDLQLKNPAGQRLVINPESLAFSSTGSWMVAETLAGSFVRINLATLQMTAFAPAFGAQGSPGLLKSRVTVSDNGRFVAVMNQEASSFRVYDLATCGASTSSLQPQGCQAYDYFAFARQQISGLQSIRHLRFINDGLLSFDAVTSAPSGTGIYELAPAASITSLTDYIGLGDSYTAGEGAFDYLGDTDTADNMCHLSRHSYPLLLTDQLFGASGGHSVACSGAVINDVGSTSDSYQGQVKGIASLHELQQNQPLLLEAVETNFLPGYVAQQRFVKRWQPGIVTVSVGGNDVGFGNLLLACVLPHVSRHVSDSTCFNTYEDRLELQRLIDRTVLRWIALYHQLRQNAPVARIYAIGYPQLVYDKGSCAINVVLSKSELEFATSLIDYLNQDIRKAADAAGVTYVDISQALAGHRLCETASYNVAVNGLTAGRDGGPLGARLFGKESYHPNMLGQELIEQAILRQTHNLAALPPTSATPDGSLALLQAPKSGRPISLRQPVTGLTSGVGQRGATVLVKTAGRNAGLRSVSGYSVRLDGPGGITLGTTTSDGEGNISTAVVMPATVSPGGHIIDIIGQNQTGEAVDITEPIYVPDSEADSEGDGIPDVIDSCPGAINSGQDTDQDGSDDVCDSLIGLPPVPGGGRSQTKGDSPSASGGFTSNSSGDSSSTAPQQPAEITLQAAAQSWFTDKPAPVTVQPAGARAQVKVLGAATITQQSANPPHPAQRRPSVTPSTTPTAPPRQSAPLIIRWRYWLWVLAFCWLLLLLAVAFCLRQMTCREQPA